MKRYSAFLIPVVLLSVAVVYLTSKPRLAPVQTEAQKEQKRVSDFLDRRLTMSFADADYSLIALKHGISAKLSKNIITDYETAISGSSSLDDFYDTTVSNPVQERNVTTQVMFPEASSTEQIVAAIGQKHQVSVETVAGILFDYKLLKKSSSDSE